MHIMLIPVGLRSPVSGPIILPAVVVAAIYGEHGVGRLLILSQVILSLQLSFAVVPLVWFTSQKSKMGRFCNSPWLSGIAWLVTIVIIGFNGYLLMRTFSDWSG